MARRARGAGIWIWAVVVSLVLPCCSSPASEDGISGATPIATEATGEAGAANPGATRFAVIGDYGLAGTPEREVAALVAGWAPEFVITTGDNNYPSGEQATIDQNIGQYYHDFIYPYHGSFGQGADRNRFFPSLGNHDWYASGAQPYVEYFTLPGNERYYEFAWGPVRFFALDSDPAEPDGIAQNSAQGQWLRGRLAAAREPWKVVYMHHAPYSSGQHGDTAQLQWPYAAWGASAVLAGHDHTYERIERDGIPYFVNGLGGMTSRYKFGSPVPGSQVRYNADHGAMLVEADGERMAFYFYTRTGALVDSFSIGSPSPAATATTTASATATQR